jgi:hypothetical protein
VALFLSQTVTVESELIIYNTDVDHPLELDHTFTDHDRARVRIYNTNIDQHTNHRFTSTGAIRRNAVSQCRGNLYVTWDDDDIFLPWNLQQCLDGLTRTGARAWKPKQNIIWWRDQPELQHNVLEASVIMHISHAVFDDTSGPEGMRWYNSLRESGQLIEDTHSIPSYCYYWKDPPAQGGHKQGNSADIHRADNFSHHMANCHDVAQRPLTKKSVQAYKEIYLNFKKFFPKHDALVQKYVPKKFFR